MCQVIECTIQYPISFHFLAFLFFWIWNAGPLVFFIFFLELLFGLNTGEFYFCKLGALWIDSGMEFENLFFLEFLVEKLFNHFLIFQFPALKIEMVMDWYLIPSFLFKFCSTLRFQMAGTLNSGYFFVFAIVKRSVPCLVSINCLIFIYFLSCNILLGFNLSPFDIAQLI